MKYKNNKHMTLKPPLTKTFYVIFSNKHTFVNCGILLN